MYAAYTPIPCKSCLLYTSSHFPLKRFNRSFDNMSAEYIRQILYVRIVIHRVFRLLLSFGTCSGSIPADRCFHLAGFRRDSDRATEMFTEYGCQFADIIRRT